MKSGIYLRKEIVYMFAIHSNINYDNGIHLGRAVVFMNKNNHAAKVDFIYMLDENDNWSFHYENGTCLTDEEKSELGNWFITCYLNSHRK